MIDPERIAAATANVSVVPGSSGVIAEFNDAGVLDPLDVLSSAAIARLVDEQDPASILAAALTVRGSRLGHVCIRPHALPETIVLDPDEAGFRPSLLVRLSGPSPHPLKLSSSDSAYMFGRQASTTQRDLKK